MVMDRAGQRARQWVEGVLRLRGAIDDAVVYRASVMLANMLMLEERYEEAEELLTSLPSNLRTTYTQSTQAKKLLERVQKQIARDVGEQAKQEQK